MGKLILLILVVAALILVVGTWMYLMDKSKAEQKTNALGDRKRLRALEKTSTQQEGVLREIQEIATTSGYATGDPLWELVAQKIEEVLDERKDTR